MAVGTSETDLARLRRDAELAIQRSRGGEHIQGLLQRIVEVAPEGSEPFVFAHRHLGEMIIEAQPWKAALHLRKIMAACPQDEAVHALMGLAQALLGNFRSSVAGYRHALELAPRNPWYHHNLGHLLDVALGLPDPAEQHLRSAHRLEPLEHEITASLAHCIAGNGQLGEARELATEAVAEAPRNADHRALLQWIEEGAPRGKGPRVAAEPLPRVSARSSNHAVPPLPKNGAVLHALERGMTEAGFSSGQVDCACTLWADFHDGRPVRIVKPEVYAAAIEYAMTLVHEVHGATQASIARKYGIAPRTLSSRYGEIRDALCLQPGDPRYA